MAGPQHGRGRLQVERHSGIGYELVPALDAPVLQMAEQLPDVLQFFATCLPVVAEQVINVPKISFEDIPTRVYREPQLGEQLVEVPTILYFLKQTVDNPVPRGGLQGSGPGLFSPAVLDSADEALEGVFRTFTRGKSARVAGQVSAQLGGHVSSSTLSAHQMARAGVAAHSSASSLDDLLFDEDGDGGMWMRLPSGGGLCLARIMG